MSKSVLEVIYSCSVGKTASKNYKYSRNETILKMRHRHYGLKIKIPKNMQKSILEVIYSSSVRKTAWKSTKYSRNEMILNIGHRAKPIVTLGHKLQFQKTRLKKHQILEKWDDFKNSP